MECLLETGPTDTHASSKDCLTTKGAGPAIGPTEHGGAGVILAAQNTQQRTNSCKLLVPCSHTKHLLQLETAAYP